jgi:hypothetical protein
MARTHALMESVSANLHNFLRSLRRQPDQDQVTGPQDTCRIGVLLADQPDDERRSRRWAAFGGRMFSRLLARRPR